MIHYYNSGKKFKPELLDYWNLVHWLLYHWTIYNGIINKKFKVFYKTNLCLCSLSMALYII